nr:hypothetical protein [Runella rosea]
MNNLVVSIMLPLLEERICEFFYAAPFVKVVVYKQFVFLFSHINV